MHGLGTDGQALTSVRLFHGHGGQELLDRMLCTAVPQPPAGRSAHTTGADDSDARTRRMGPLSSGFLLTLMPYHFSELVEAPLVFGDTAGAEQRHSMTAGTWHPRGKTTPFTCTTC